MTNGSSQGLFVIMAVVIFGILVSISYILFRDTLQPSLANIFEDSLENPVSLSKGFRNVNTMKGYFSTLKQEESGVFIADELIGRGSPEDPQPSGLYISEDIEIPYNHKLFVSFDIFVEYSGKVILSLDLNSSPKGTSWNGNDNFGTSNFTPNRYMFHWDEVEGNSWHRKEFWYVNNHSKNKDKQPIYEDKSFGSLIGVQSSEVSKKGIKKLMIKNIKYKVVPYI